MKQIAMFVVGCALVACGDSSSPPPSSGADAGAPTSVPGNGNGDTSADSGIGGGSVGVRATVTLQVPASFKGTTRKLDVVVVPSLPIMGPPAGVLYEASTPAVTAGQSMVIQGDAASITGDFYVVAVLYVDGGGQFSPKAGVDYDAFSAQKVHFDGKPVDLGTMALALDGS